jgi:hypothetical protein
MMTIYKFLYFNSVKRVQFMGPFDTCSAPACYASPIVNNPIDEFLLLFKRCFLKMTRNDFTHFSILAVTVIHKINDVRVFFPNYRFELGAIFRQRPIMFAYWF